MLALLALAMTVCLGLAYAVPYHGNHSGEIEQEGWIWSIVLTLAGASLFFLTGLWKSRKRAHERTLRRREAMALVGLGWVVGGVTVSLPFMLCGPSVSFENALFEGVSGLTTTGATIFVEIESLPRSILLWRSLTQWVGGMGILAMFVVVLSGVSANHKALIGAESSLSNTDISTLKRTMRKLWLLYLCFTVICGLGLVAMGLTPFEALNHALTAASTGGFGTENTSVGGDPFGTGSKLWLVLFMLLGALSFPFYLAVLERKPLRVLRERFEEIFWFLGIVVFACLLLFLQKWRGGLEEDGVDILFNVVSIVTSTGYVSSDYTTWGGVGVVVLLALMVVGGCSGSTSGGLKVSRMILWFRFVRTNLRRTFRPQAVLQVRLNGRSVPEGTQEGLFLVFSFYAFFAIFGTLLFLLLEPGHTLFGAISVIVSCLGNTGPALAEMHAADAFVRTGVGTKMLFVTYMILGRLEYVALLVLFTRQLWKRY